MKHVVNLGDFGSVEVTYNGCDATFVSNTVEIKNSNGSDYITAEKFASQTEGFADEVHINKVCSFGWGFSDTSLIGIVRRDHVLLTSKYSNV